MSTLHTLAFMGLYALSMLYQRLKFRFYPATFLRLNLLRRLTGWNIHHGHWGLLLMLASGLRNAFFGHSSWSSLVFILGLGLLSDELVAYFSSSAGQSRVEELEAYARSFKATIALACAVEAAILVLTLFSPFTF